MRADPDAIRTLGAAGSEMAADVAAVGAALAKLPMADIAPIFGPVGAGFLAALAAAVAEQSAAIAVLSHSVAAASGTAFASAAAYREADGRVGTRLGAGTVFGGP